jgi:acyl-CoA thioesterase-1
VKLRVGAGRMRLAALFIALACTSTAAAETLRIVAFGDSNTYGYGVDRADTYPAKLERALRAKQHDVIVGNAGVNGDNTEGALRRLEWTVPLETDIVIVEFGTNDRRAGFTPATTRGNLDTIVERVRLFGAQVLLSNYRDVDLAALAAKHDALYFEWGAPRQGRYYVGGNPGNHLNAAGYDVIVARMLPLVEQLIARVKATSEGD